MQCITSIPSSFWSLILVAAAAATTAMLLLLQEWSVGLLIMEIFLFSTGFIKKIIGLSEKAIDLSSKEFKSGYSLGEFSFLLVLHF